MTGVFKVPRQAACPYSIQRVPQNSLLTEHRLQLVSAPARRQKALASPGGKNERCWQLTCQQGFSNSSGFDRVSRDGQSAHTFAGQRRYRIRNSRSDNCDSRLADATWLLGALD